VQQIDLKKKTPHTNQVPPEWASSTVCEEYLSQILMAYLFSAQWHMIHPPWLLKIVFIPDIASYVCQTCTWRTSPFKKLQERINSKSSAQHQKRYHDI
jgi:hypothetical protein